MSELDDRLRCDGGRWRAEVDRRHPADPDALLDQVTAAATVTPLQALQQRVAGRTPLLLSVAAVSVAALAVGSAAVLTAGPRHTRPSPSALASIASPTVLPVPPTATPLPTIARGAPAPTSTRRVGGVVAPASTTASRHRKHRTKHRPSASRSTTVASTAPVACDTSTLGLSVSSPVSGGDQASMTVSVVNNGAAACSVSGFPTVQLVGDATITAAPNTETPAPLTLAAGAAATAEVDWGTRSGDDTCPSYPTILVGAPGGSTVQFPLDPPVPVCDASTLVTHPLR